MSVAEMDIKQKQEAYHDWEASNYDDKFSISYDQRCIDYAIARFRKVIPEGRTFDKVLEIGAGTGFFLINLWQGGAIGDDIHATDISTGMLAVCQRNAATAGLRVTTKQGDAESLPYPDDEFDLVIGHAFLHHLPEPDKAIGEMFRVLKPGGELIVAGEPTLWGDRIATVFKRGAYKTFRTVTRLPFLKDLRRPDTRDERDDTDAAVAALEDEVDLHTFRPEDVENMARGVGFDGVEVVTEELTGNWMGWTARTIEASARPGALGMGWAMFNYRTYLALSFLDDHVFARVVPDRFFYNLILHARKPGGAA